MASYGFIFSNKPSQRMGRHLLFWLVLLLHFIIQNLIVGGYNEAVRTRGFFESAFNALFFFPTYILSTYILIYGILPTFFFRHRYIAFFFLTAGILITDFVVCSLSGALYMHIYSQVPFYKITFNGDKYNAFVNGVFLPITFLGIAGGIKIAKNWYLEQKENERLAKEKNTKELQLLKTQLHPRFLFYSLHTIKKNIASKPVLASELILQLSDLLSYILYESDTQWIWLQKEIDIIKSYVDLQKKSRGSKLTVELDIVGITPGQYIFPLLLLSFIENVFDFVLKENQKNPLLKLFVNASGAQLDYQLICIRFFDKMQDQLEVRQHFFNLQKQLDFIYPNIHQLEITIDEEDISIEMVLPLHIITTKEETILQNAMHEPL